MKQKHNSFRLTLMLTLLMLLGTSLTAGASFVSNGIYYNITSSSSKTVEVIKKPSGKYSGSVTIPSSVTYSGVTYSVTAIHDSAFRNCSSLTSVSMPNTITKIGAYAFAYCTSLPNITIPNSVTSLGNHSIYYSGITQAILPYGLKTIGSQSFYMCNSLTTVLIPSSVTSVGSMAFRYCPSLTTLYCNMATPPSMDFYNVPATCKIYVPVGKVQQYKNASDWSDRASYIQAGAYDFNFGTSGYNASSNYHMTVTSTTPVTYNGTTYAGTAKYVYHPNIATAHEFSVSLYETDNMCGSGMKYLMTELGDSCCAGMSSSLTSLNFSSCTKMTKIGHDAFYNANGLKTITLPPNLTTIGQSAFEYARKLESITIPNTVTSMSTYVFYGCPQLKSVTWSTGLKSIPGSTFCRCTALTSFKFPHWITSIGDYAFYKSALENATLPYGLKTIGTGAFKESDVYSALIPSSVTSVASDAFASCSNLEWISCNMPTPPSNLTIPSSCMGLFVPIGSLGQYESAFGSSVEVMKGAYDFDRDGNNVPFGNYHMTVTSTSSVTVGGVTYDGTAKYVFPCYCSDTYDEDRTTFNGKLAETNNMCGGNKKYLITAVDNECFDGLDFVEVNLSNCTQMTSIGNYAFRECEDLYDIDLPSSLATIGKYAFSQATDLRYIDMPNSVTTVGEGAFKGCSGMTDMRWSSNAKSIPDYCFDGGNLYLLESFPSGITSIGKYAFRNCLLKKANISTGLTTIETYAFYGCENLGSVTLPTGLTTIGAYAFDGCKQLTQATIPNTVTTMGTDVFHGCDKLWSVTWSTGMKTIPNYTFYNCPRLSDFKIPNGITSIGNSAFAYTAITNAIVPYGVTTIGDGAFSYNTKLTTVLIPSSVSSMGSNMFNFCTNLSTLYCNMATPTPAMYFSSSANIDIYVPVGKVQQYKNAWSGWASKIQAGACDICLLDEDGGLTSRSPYHYSIISSTPVTYNGTTYAGTAKYVYHPMIEETTAHTWSADLYITDDMCGGNKKYLITEIGDSAFYNMSQTVSSMDFTPCAKLTTIGAYAFRSSKLESLTLPASVTTYGKYALYNMSSLYNLTVKNPTPVTVPSTCFYSTDQARATLHVPTQAAVTAYKAKTYWKNFYLIVCGEGVVRGDVNEDEYIDPNDLSDLIDYLINGKSVNLNNADCDQNGTVDPNDLSALIDYLINGTWPVGLKARDERNFELSETVNESAPVAAVMPEERVGE